MDRGTRPHPGASIPRADPRGPAQNNAFFAQRTLYPVYRRGSAGGRRTGACLVLSEYVSLQTIIEDPVENFKSALRSLNVFAKVDEGEEIYTGTEPWAIVIPGPDTIRLEGNQQLRHSMRIYVNFLWGVADGIGSLEELRLPAEEAFDHLLTDQTRGGTCFNCLPLSWHPGFMTYGEYTFAGIQTTWAAENWQTFPLPSKTGRTWENMKDVIEKIIAAFKDEIFDVPGIDDINEGEELYTGEGTVAWVIPGPTSIASSMRARLQHTMTIYQNLLSSSETMTLAEMRTIGEAAYDALMQDITHDRSCTVCLPTLWHPGFLKFGAVSYVGILSNWDARILMPYTPT